MTSSSNFRLLPGGAFRLLPGGAFRLLLGTFLILLLAAPASAGSSPDAQKWLEKMISIYDQGPFKVDYAAELDMSSLGQAMSGSLKGKLTQADRTHSRIELELDMSSPPGMPEGETSMSILVVTDGMTVWQEMANPALGGRQVTKVSLADLEELGDSAGGLGVSPTSMDPVAQLETMTRVMDFEVLERAGGAVTLQGTIKDEARAELGMLAAPGVNGFIIVIDEKTGFPTQVRADGENPFVTMHFRNLEFVDAASLADGLFDYSPPEGSPVMDLGPMLKSQSP